MVVEERSGAHRKLFRTMMAVEAVTAALQELSGTLFTGVAVVSDSQWMLRRSRMQSGCL
uniref:Uncharacterized protein n=1 Tax=Arion vulgaris TaxID=1028688 RepID=A0A0B6ZD18_9EUPU